MNFRTTLGRLSTRRNDIYLNNMMKPLNFKNEGLVVHWLEFSVEGLCDLEKIQELANYFHQEFGLNSNFRESSELSWKQI